MTIEVTAKKPEDAIKQGLEQLGATLDEVEVEVLESGGLFRKAKVRLTIEREDKPKEKEPEKKPQSEKAEKVEKIESEKVEKAEKSEKTEKPVKTEKAEKAEKAAKPEKQEKSKPALEKTQKNQKEQKADKAAKADKPEKVEKADKVEKAEKTPRHTKEEEKQALEHACEFVKNVIDKMGFEAEVALNEESGMIDVNAPAGDDALIIGRHGETLSALSYLAETAERAEKFRIGVAVDCNGYRERRAASLSAMARRRADECVNKHRRIKLEAMDRVDRRTIHFALADDDRVTTASEGKEPHRFIVICPKK